MPYLDPQVRMTVAPWHTANLGPDYRLPPLEAKNETFTWPLPKTMAPGKVAVEVGPPLKAPYGHSAPWRGSPSPQVPRLPAPQRFRARVR